MIKDSILIECCEDYVGLWAIAWEFREIQKEKDASEIRRKTMQVVEELLNADLIQAGTFSEDGDFEVWKLQTPDILKRIESEWDVLRREPNLGEIAWFIATDQGEKEAKKIA
jgi:hypothetical protein